MADLSVAELRAVYGAARWGVTDTDDAFCWQEWMRQEAGRNWRVNLRRGLAALSRELAKADFVEKRRR